MPGSEEATALAKASGTMSTEGEKQVNGVVDSDTSEASSTKPEGKSGSKKEDVKVYNTTAETSSKRRIPRKMTGPQKKAPDNDTKPTVRKLRSVERETSVEEEHDNDLVKYRYERTMKEAEQNRKKQEIKRFEEEIEALTAAKKQVERRLADEEADARLQKGKVEKIREQNQKLKEEVAELRESLDKQLQQNNQLERKLKKFEVEATKSIELVKVEQWEKEKHMQEKNMLENEKIRLKKEISDLSTENASLGDNIRRLKSQITELEEASYDKSDEMELMKARREKQYIQATLEEQLEDLNDKMHMIEQLQQNKMKLEDTNEALRQELRRELDTREQEIDSIKSKFINQIKDLENQLEEKQDEKQKIVKEQQQLVATVEELSTKLSKVPKVDVAKEKKLRRELRRVRALLKDSQAVVSHTQEKEPKRDQVKLLKKQLDEAEFAKTLLQKTNSTLEHEMEELQHQLEELTREKRQSEDKVSALTRENKSAESRLEEANEDIDDFTKKLKVLATQLAQEKEASRTQMARMNDLHQHNSELKQAVMEMKNKMADMEAAMVSKMVVRQLEDQIAMAEGQLENAMSTKARMEQTINRLNENIDKQQEEHAAELKSTKTKLQTEIDELQSQLQELKDQHGAVVRKETEAQQKQRDAETALEAANEKQEQLSNELKLAQRRIEDLHKALQDEALPDEELEDDLLSDDEGNDANNDVDSFLSRHRSFINNRRERASSVSSLGRLDNIKFPLSKSDLNLDNAKLPQGPPLVEFKAKEILDNIDKLDTTAADRTTEMLRRELLGDVRHGSADPADDYQGSRAGRRPPRQKDNYGSLDRVNLPPRGQRIPREYMDDQYAQYDDRSFRPPRDPMGMGGMNPRALPREQRMVMDDGYQYNPIDQLDIRHRQSFDDGYYRHQEPRQPLPQNPFLEGMPHTNRGVLMQTMSVDRADRAPNWYKDVIDPNDM